MSGGSTDTSSGGRATFGRRRRALARAALVVAAASAATFLLNPSARDVSDEGRRMLARNDRNRPSIAVREERRQRQRRHDRAEERRVAREGRQESGAVEDGSERTTRVTGSGRGLLSSLLAYTDPRSMTPRTQLRAFERERREALQTADGLVEEATRAANKGEAAFLVRGREEDDATSMPAFFAPSEILVEVLNPKPDCRYSVSIVSEGRYTGSAQLLSPDPPLEEGQAPPSLLHSWRPALPGKFAILVHEIDPEYGHTTPLISPGPFPIYVEEAPRQTPGAGVALLENRVQNMPPCQSVRDNPHLFHKWDGDWLGPQLQLDNSIRTGWSFVPAAEMGCKLETYGPEDLAAIPEKKRIYILGRSVERGVFLSLADMMLDKKEKKMLKHSVVGKCWGRATVTKGNLEIMYQDFRVNAFEDPNEPRYIECHNEKLVKTPGSSFIQNATQVWEEIFHQPAEEWPSVVFLVAGVGAVKFQFQHHVQAFVASLPKEWTGTLFIGDFEFSARGGGFMDRANYQQYLATISDLTSQLNDPRVRWIDGVGISREMRLYSQKGEEYISRSQHFHRPCMRTDPDDRNKAMVVCSNVTEMVGQLLLGHALGPKEEFRKQVEQSGGRPKESAMRWCHACPKCMLPFHIAPYPQMECVDGPITRKEESADCGAVRENRGNLHGKGDPMLCPDECLQTPVTSSFGTESDNVNVRQCPIE